MEMGTDKGSSLASFGSICFLILRLSNAEWSQLPTLSASGDFCQHQLLSLCLTWELTEEETIYTSLPLESLPCLLLPDCPWGCSDVFKRIGKCHSLSSSVNDAAICHFSPACNLSYHVLLYYYYLFFKKYGKPPRSICKGLVWKLTVLPFCYIGMTTEG